MLLTAARQQSDSVFVDLLTFQDLEALKSKKAAAAAAAAGGAPAGGAAPAAPPPRPLPASAAGKRYLILTYASEFDRVHYPLPLAQEGPDTARLLSVISELRREVARLEAKRGGGGGASGPQWRGGGGARRAGDDVATPADAGGGEEAELLEARRGSGGLASSSGPAAALAQRLEAVGAARAAAQPGRARGHAAAVVAPMLHAWAPADRWRPPTLAPQVTQERDLLRARLESAEADAAREDALHRRELRRKAKEWQEVRAPGRGLALRGRGTRQGSGAAACLGRPAATRASRAARLTVPVVAPNPFARPPQVHEELLRARDTIRDLRAKCRCGGGA
jgi:coiled-coil domain-containing protein 61